MSAEQLLKHVRALSASERRKFLKSINTLRERKASRKGAAPNRVKWPDVEARAQRIFGHRILPNLVELDRNKSAGWCAIDRIKDYAKTATSWSEK